MLTLGYAQLSIHLGGKSKAAVDGNWSLTFTDSGDKNGGNET